MDFTTSKDFTEIDILEIARKLSESIPLPTAIVPSNLRINGLRCIPSEILPPNTVVLVDEQRLKESFSFNYWNPLPMPVLNVRDNLLRFGASLMPQFIQPAFNLMVNLAEGEPCTRRKLTVKEKIKANRRKCNIARIKRKLTP